MYRFNQNTQPDLLYIRVHATSPHQCIWQLSHASAPARGVCTARPIPVSRLPAQRQQLSRRVAPPLVKGVQVQQLRQRHTPLRGPRRPAEYGRAARHTRTWDARNDSQPWVRPPSRQHLVFVCAACLPDSSPLAASGMEKQPVLCAPREGEEQLSRELSAPGWEGQPSWELCASGEGKELSRRVTPATRPRLGGRASRPAPSTSVRSVGTAGASSATASASRRMPTGRSQG